MKDVVTTIFISAFLIALTAQQVSAKSVTGKFRAVTGNTTLTGNGAVRHMRPGLVPFPQSVDDLHIFPYEEFFFVTGSSFISIEADNTCWKCQFEEDLNQCLQLNQTLCDDILEGGICPDTVANLSCVEFSKNSSSGPIFVQKRPFKDARPACYVRKGSLLLQPVFDSRLYVLQPKLESCNFVITRQIPAQFLQFPDAPVPIE